MGKVYLTLQERENAARERIIRRNLAEIKHGIGYERICLKTGYSAPTVAKVVNTPLKARLEQLYAVADAAGIKDVFEK